MSGSPTARIVVVGDCWGNWDEQRGESFSGPAGDLLNRLLAEAGISRSECFLTNLVNSRPPNQNIDVWIPPSKKGVRANFIPIRGRSVDPIIAAGLTALRQEINLIRPNVILALGGAALWALTGLNGILRWRGSQIWTDDKPRTKLIPSIHPSAILREMSLRPIVIHDIKRAAAEAQTPDYQNEPKWNFIVRPTYSLTMEVLDRLLAGATSGETEWIDFDFETRFNHIDCIGLSWSRTDAICIPFLSSERREGYWTLEEEAAIVYKLYQLLTHPRIKVRGQNLLYDSQYSYRHWHFVPRVAQDTMISFHTAFCGMRKSLDFQASLLCDHYVQWKPEKTAWKVGG